MLGTGEGGEKGLRACDKSIGKRRSVRRPPSPPPPPPPGSPTPPRRRRRRGPHPGPSISGLWRPRPRTGDRSRRPHIGSEVEGEGGECPAVGRSGERRRAKLMCLLSPETTAQPPRIPSLLPPKDHPSSSHAPTWGSTVDRRRTHLAIRPTLVLDPADHPSSPLRDSKSESTHRDSPMDSPEKHDSAVFFTWPNLGESLSCWTQDSEGEGWLQDGEKVFSRRCPLFLFSSSLLLFVHSTHQGG